MEKTSQPVIRQLLHNEYSRCSNIWHMASDAEMANQFYRELVSGNRVIFVCVSNGELIGEGALVFSTGDPDYTQPGRRIYLSRLIVKENVRRRGIGSLIVDHLLQHASHLGYKEFSIGVDKDNFAARRLYEQKGFNDVIFQGRDDHGEFVKLLKRIPFD